MKILYVEPYYSGSHKSWINSYQKKSNNNIEILSLPGKKWKWRMHGGAIELANQFNHNNKNFDLILCSDMLNLPVFKSLCNKNILDSKIAMYFHENQLSYPWSPKDADVKYKRDLHYAFINYTSSLVSDFNFFNSEYHYNSYINELKKYLNKMPDFKNKSNINIIKKKSKVLYLGCDLKNMFSNTTPNKNPVILWNHRWEYDKNPNLFFNTLFQLKKEKIKFSLIVVGKKYTQFPEIFSKARDLLKNEIIYFGYCESKSKYISLLNESDILPVTSNQDFFGISIMEAISCNCYPILPNRLTYPELFDIKKNKSIFYNSDKELKNKIISVITNLDYLKTQNINFKNKLIEKFDWQTMSTKYDSIFESYFT